MSMRDVKVRITYELLKRKFAPGTDLAQMLIATAPAELIEGNTRGDTFWGVCDGEGLNTLGCMLMRIRDDLIKGENANDTQTTGNT